MKLTVFGASGGVGREVVTQALDRDDHVTAYVRNAAKVTSTHPNLTVVAGELTDREAVQRAVRGADAIISALGPSLDRKATGMPLVDGTRTIVDAMRAEGAERYIGMATPSLRDPRDTGSLLGRLVPFMGARSSRAPTASSSRCPSTSPTARGLPPGPDDRQPLPPRRARHQQLRRPRPVPCQGNRYPIGTRAAADAPPRRCLRPSLTACAA